MKLFITYILLHVTLIAGVFDFDTISSDFNQTITNDENSKIVYEGSFYATVDAKALWIYKKPVEKKMYFSKNQVVILEPQLEQAIITNLENTPNLTSILRSAKKIDNNTYEAVYEELKYVIHTQNGIIASISYKDRLENDIKIELSNQQINTFLDDTLFKAKIPDGFDIITQ